LRLIEKSTSLRKEIERIEIENRKEHEEAESKKKKECQRLKYLEAQHTNSLNTRPNDARWQSRRKPLPFSQEKLNVRRSCGGSGTSVSTSV
jgi:septal ring factor EnvC (AmiA/AmiB activator)